MGKAKDSSKELFVLGLLVIVILAMIFMAIYINANLRELQLCKDKIVLGLGSLDCCLESAREIANKNYSLANNVTCPKGYGPSAFQCSSSLVWCEPK